MLSGKMVRNTIVCTGKTAMLFWGPQESGAATSRSQLARRINISLPTVMRVIDELISNGLVRETGEKESSGGDRRRP